MKIVSIMKTLLTTSVFLTAVIFSLSAQEKRSSGQITTTGSTAPATIQPVPPPRTGPKPYKEVITEKARSTNGLFTVHKVEDKYYFEIPDSIFGREIMVITRFSKVAGGGGIYGGELANQQVVRLEKGPDNKVFMRVVTVISVANDSSQPIFKAVSNSNLDPIGAAFDIKVLPKDSTGTVIDVTDFFKGDNQPVSLNSGNKRRLSLGGLMSDRSYIETVKSFPINTEIRAVKTFSSSAGSSFPTSGPLPGRSLPAASAAGAVTLETNTSFIVLPKHPMRKRLYDSRVGYFADEYSVYSDDQQKVEESNFIVRWRLEPKDEDIEKWKRGELVEPKKPIVYYIDPATPKKWRPYLIQGINDWQKAFEKAGFKNAIMGKEWPENDSSMSLEDARFSVIRYFASDIQNAYGPNAHDPRSGEIIESHIGWYHNVMELLHNWYFVQAAAVDPGARKMKFDDDLMGSLIRFVSSHEVGHTLGLRHNMGSSSKTPVEKLRNKEWVEANGHTASIMDYARFNYVAQPEDSISRVGLFPRIGEYDLWAIEWGYKPIPASKDEEEDKKILNKWINERLAANPRLWFGTFEFGNTADPRAQREDLSDNAMKASEYGIRNLKRIMTNLPQWTKEEADRYENLSNMYNQVVSQFQQYLGHVSTNIGGFYETPKSVEQKGDVYEIVPRWMQKDAVTFLHKQLFETPSWILDRNILNKISSPNFEQLSNIQDGMLSSLLSSSRLGRIISMSNRYDDAYQIDEYFIDLKKGIWSELGTKRKVDNYRRNLQKIYVDRVIALTNTSSPNIPSTGGFVITFGPDVRKTDISSVARAHLSSLRNEIINALPLVTDNMTRYHLQDVAERIRVALNPR
jgi:Met-zincin/Domain of unknown function (DUF5117)/Domain of unknown function (DUF5118)